ncbi:MAG: 30S ribosomal protein S6 [Nitrospinae bacterium RIFCSPLOWO2_02_FULL_39_110]|nr:MAG: 30S ribosomal protein S6 [Nitrospinae bacterium RIFCSPHIGHO2_02_39_11]OGV98792.1 MAG: 30S ribosomal protein S6 [Nitrospinae bacterium RIFCSPHIGHO2_12_FULL_39_42]OGV99897.1 MAG: 30S ribosomal protein S6 [Nitrospinae bacterium RIFCSPHIGHO2_02_FULL_39_82]OGW04152.1 MAG: 30S ribosomal protein S6 [Nitrospinae bacterium RIFCSPLOWO2_02_FULL_39_110]OGW06477.1 MAG: 30S ribosomal protein S6 [Nitrospinae bacterium RIFCSPLOWO2_02_39_17]OGW09166.1 MAG: 30S ribosomal protein S6 [Nitrospinae bacteriu
MRPYESIFVLKPDLDEKKVDGQIEKVKEFIEKNGGKVITLEKWGKKKLAYIVKKNRFGIYVFIHFESEPALISNLQRNYKLNEDIIRYMTVLYKESAKKAAPEERASSGLQNAEGVTEAEDDMIEGAL